MSESVYAIKNGDVQLTIPNNVGRKALADGTAVVFGSRIMVQSETVGADDRAAVAAVLGKYRSMPQRCHDEILAVCPSAKFWGWGDNGDGRFLGTLEEAVAAGAMISQAEAGRRFEAKERNRAIAREHRISFVLATTNGGDGDPLVWHGNREQSEEDILAECRALLSVVSVDDHPTDEEIVDAIRAAKRAAYNATAVRESAEGNEAAALEAAKKTGEKVAIRTWITNECHNGHRECSFDQACEWAMPDGSKTVTYTCCY